jgi:hypothetical protein
MFEPTPMPLSMRSCALTTRLTGLDLRHFQRCGVFGEADLADRNRLGRLIGGGFQDRRNDGQAFLGGHTGRAEAHDEQGGNQSPG